MAAAYLFSGGYLLISSTAGNVIFNGGATDGLGIHNSVTSTITANNITLNGTATLAPNWVTYIGSMTINSSFVGGNITVTGTVVNTPGAAGGIYQTGAITARSGSNISFTSNNDIDQNGAISLVANGSGAVATISYDTRTGNSTSRVSAATVTIAAGTSNSAINYLVRTNGAIITVPAITVPGHILLDNTCVGCTTRATPTTAAANGAAITISGALSAGSLAATAMINTQIATAAAAMNHTAAGGCGDGLD
jgi:hypothetical protein